MASRALNSPQPSLTEDRGLEWILECATPDLYRRNGFRILGLPVTASMQDIRGKEQQCKMMEKLGVSTFNGNGYLPLEPTPTLDDIRAGVHRLSNMETRLLDEFFWFWPGGAVEDGDKGLSFLRENKASDAARFWMEREKGQSSGMTSTHNLAVLHHLCALDLEFRSQSGNLTPSDLGKRDEHWKNSYKRWTLLQTDDSFWIRLNKRIRELNDPRLTTGFGKRIRESLPKTILLVNARLALQAAERDNSTEVSRLKGFMESSGFDGILLNECLRECLAPIRQRIKMLCETAGGRVASNGEAGADAAWELMKAAEPLLKTMRLLLKKEDAVFQGTADLVTERTLSCQIAYGHKTGDWKTSIKILEKALTLSGSKTQKDKINENLRIVKENFSASVCFFCGENPADDGACVEVDMFGDVTRIPNFQGVQVHWRHTTVRVPRCTQCKDFHNNKGSKSKVENYRKEADHWSHVVQSIEKREKEDLNARWISLHAEAEKWEKKVRAIEESESRESRERIQKLHDEVKRWKEKAEVIRQKLKAEQERGNKSFAGWPILAGCIGLLGFLITPWLGISSSILLMLAILLETRARGKAKAILNAEKSARRQLQAEKDISEAKAKAEELRKELETEEHRAKVEAEERLRNPGPKLAEALEKVKEFTQKAEEEDRLAKVRAEEQRNNPSRELLEARAKAKEFREKAEAELRRTKGMKDLSQRNNFALIQELKKKGWDFGTKPHDVY